MTLFQKYLLAMEKANEMELQALIARREAEKLQEEYRKSIQEELKKEAAANAD